MYSFKAHYTNMDNGEQITRRIEFLGDGDEKSIYGCRL